MIPTVEFYLPDGTGPFTSAEVLAQRGPRSEASWRHFELLEADHGVDRA